MIDCLKSGQDSFLFPRAVALLSFLPRVLWWHAFPNLHELLDNGSPSRTTLAGSRITRQARNLTNPGSLCPEEKRGRVPSMRPFLRLRMHIRGRMETRRTLWVRVVTELEVAGIALPGIHDNLAYRCLSAVGCFSVYTCRSVERMAHTTAGGGVIS